MDTGGTNIKLVEEKLQLDFTKGYNHITNFYYAMDMSKQAEFADVGTLRQGFKVMCVCMCDAAGAVAAAATAASYWGYFKVRFFLLK